MDFLLLLLWFYCISSFCFLLLLVFSRCCRHCLSFCPFALRSPFAFCNFRKNSLFKKGQAWQRNQGTITSTPTITTTSTTPPSHHGSTHPWCIPLCLCPCVNEDDDDDDDVEEGAVSKIGSGSALPSKCFISNCANIRNEFTILQFSIFVKQYCTYIAPSIYDVCMSVCICIVNGIVSYLIVRSPSVLYTLCHEWLTIVK